MSDPNSDLRRSFYRGRNLDRVVSISDLRAIAKRRLPALVFEYLDGGAEEELTLKRNRLAFDEIAFMPRMLRAVGKTSLSGNLLGGPVPIPMAIAPTGLNALFWPHGDMALASAAAAAGIPFTQSLVSNDTLEQVAAIPGLRHWTQLYVYQSQTVVEMILRRAKTAGSEALMVTVDGSVYGNRVWDKRNYSSGIEPTLLRKLEMLRHPRWLWSLIRHGIPRFGTLAEVLPDGKSDIFSAVTWLRNQNDPDLDWDRFDWLRRNWSRKLVLKGLLSPDDVEMAIVHGADAVVLSNHGGRQLDGAPAPIEVLSQVVPLARGRLELLVDSGIRNGSDIVKALALGADGVLVGRAGLYGLSAAGTPGAARALTLLQKDAERAAALLGCLSSADLDGRYLFNRSN